MPALTMKTKAIRIDLNVLILSLMALLIAELIAIGLISQGFSESLGGFLVIQSSQFYAVMTGSAKWGYKMVGPVIFPLLILTAAEVWSVIRLVQIRKIGMAMQRAEKQFKVLEVVESASPGFGFLGTCIALIFTMHNMDPNLNQQDMLKVLLENSSSAFGSTVFGISLALTAYLSKEIFQGFLIKPRDFESKDRAVELIQEEA